MKTLITNYSFNASAKTITFNDYSSISLESVLLITNVTDNVIIYNFSDPTLGGTVLNNVLTLTYNTTSMSNSDDIQIYYDDSAVQPANAGNQARLEDAIDAIYYLAKQLEWLTQTRSNSSLSSQGFIPAISAVLDSRSTISSISSITAVSSLNSLGFSSSTQGSSTRGTIDSALLVHYTGVSAAAAASINNIVIS